MNTRASGHRDSYRSLVRLLRSVNYRRMPLAGNLLWWATVNWERNRHVLNVISLVRLTGGNGSGVAGSYVAIPRSSTQDYRGSRLSNSI